MAPPKNNSTFSSCAAYAWQARFLPKALRPQTAQAYCPSTTVCHLNRPLRLRPLRTWLLAIPVAGLIQRSRWQQEWDATRPHAICILFFVVSPHRFKNRHVLPLAAWLLSNVSSLCLEAPANSQPTQHDPRQTASGRASAFCLRLLAYCRRCAPWCCAMAVSCQACVTCEIQPPLASACRSCSTQGITASRSIRTLSPASETNE